MKKEKYVIKILWSGQDKEYIKQFLRDTIHNIDNGYTIGYGWELLGDENTKIGD